MKRLLIAILAMVLLGGCASKMLWTKPDSTEAEFKQDNYQCVQESRTQWAASGALVNYPALKGRGLKSGKANP